MNYAAVATTSHRAIAHRRVMLHTAYAAHFLWRKEKIIIGNFTASPTFNHLPQYWSLKNLIVTSIACNIFGLFAQIASGR